MIGRVVVVAAVVGCSLLIRAAPAVAQPEAGTVFVSLAGLAVIDDGPTFTNFDRAIAGNDAGTVAGGTLGVGVHLTPRVSFRAEWSTTAELRDETTATNILSLTSFTFGSSLTPFPATAIVEARTTTRRRSTAVFSLLGYHFTGRRMSLELTGGLGLVHRSLRSSYETRTAAATLGAAFLPGPSTSETKSAAYHAVAVVGADAAVSVTSRLAVVPQVRAYVLGGALSLRPGVGLRWTF